MSIPISIQKIKIPGQDHNGRPNERIEYLVTISEKGSYWKKTAIYDRKGLLKLRDEIDNALGLESTEEILQVSSAQAASIDKAHREDPLCQGCNFRMTHNCVTCLLELQSPLERKLFLELRNAYIQFEPQYAINWQGQRIYLNGAAYSSPENLRKNILTVVDFFIEKNGIRLCVYTDGHTYHERTEDQAVKDRNIDRKLQDLGYQVLRYTGKEVNGNIEKVIGEISGWIEKGSSRY